MEPLFTVGGLASGLDTTSIISQLIDIERVPINRLEARKTGLDRVDTAWQSISSDLSALRSALDGLRHGNDWEGFATATASSEAISVEVSGKSVQQTSLAFTIESLATSHRDAYDGTFTSLDDLVGAGTFTLKDNQGSDLVTITTDGTTTLRNLVSQIDAADVGIDAQALAVTSGSFRLVLASEDTGAASQFSVTTDIASLGTGSTIATGADAHLKIGTLDVYRSTNTVTDLVDGVTIDLKATSATEVTIQTGRDVAGAVESVQGFVDTINAVLNRLKTVTAYNAESDTAGPLQGDSTARSLALRIRSAVSGTIDSLSGSFSYAGSIGISLTRDGTISLDTQKLTDALEEDFDAVAGVFSQNLNTGGEDRVSLAHATDSTKSGQYNVVATQAAKVAAVTGASYSPPAGSPKVFTVTTSDGQTVDITIDDGMSVDAAIARINAVLDAASINNVSASNDGGALRFEHSSYGSANGFTISGYGVDLDGAYSGQDVAGTIDGVAATGKGRTLTSTSGNSNGLSLTITATDAEVTGAGGSLDFGAVSYSSGIGGALDRVLEDFEGVSGSIQRARDLISGQKRLFDDQIEAFEIRVELRSTSLRRKFAGLESTLGQLQAQGNWLAGQLASLTGGTN